TSALDSTGRDHASKPFWDAFSTEISKRLPSHTVTGSAASVVIVNEAYTSKTCGSCGCLNERLGGSKHFHCPHCHFHIDRDVNGARNILIRFLTLLNSREKSTGVIGPRCVEAGLLRGGIYFPLVALLCEEGMYKVV